MGYTAVWTITQDFPVQNRPSHVRYLLRNRVTGG